MMKSQEQIPCDHASSSKAIMYSTLKSLQFPRHVPSCGPICDLIVVNDKGIPASLPVPHLGLQERAETRFTGRVFVFREGLTRFSFQRRLSSVSKCNLRDQQSLEPQQRWISSSTKKQLYMAEDFLHAKQPPSTEPDEARQGLAYLVGQTVFRNPGVPKLSSSATTRCRAAVSLSRTCGSYHPHDPRAPQN